MSQDGRVGGDERNEPEQVELIVAAVESAYPDGLPPPPPGWPGEAEAALLDAVFSMRARYGNSPTTGVRGIVARWRTERGGGPLDDLRHLARQNPGKLAALVCNHQKVPGRTGATKAEAVIQAASRLDKDGYRDAASIVADEPAGVASRAYQSVPGLGPVTWDYLRMLLGATGVKADIMIRRFVTSALDSDRPISASQATALVTAAAQHFDVDATHLDHAIWRHQRKIGTG